jgi:hypothetical protein
MDKDAKLGIFIHWILECYLWTHSCPTIFHILCLCGNNSCKTDQNEAKCLILHLEMFSRSYSIDEMDHESDILSYFYENGFQYTRFHRYDALRPFL